MIPVAKRGFVVDNRTIRVRHSILAGAVLALLALLAGAAPAFARKEAPPTHYRVAIDPKSAEKDLLPVPPAPKSIGTNPGGCRDAA